MTPDDRKREAVKELMAATLALLDSDESRKYHQAKKERAFRALEACRVAGVDD